MSYLNTINQYNLSKDSLNKLLRIYYNLGRNEYFKLHLEEYLEIHALEEINALSMCIADNLNLKVTQDRTRLILLKDSTPKNKQEQTLLNIKKSLLKMYSDAFIKNLSINSSDILDYLKYMTGNDHIEFSKKEFVLQNEKNTVRYFFNKTIDTLNESLEIKSNEPFITLAVSIMELVNMKPYSDYNELACFILELYLLFRYRILGLFTEGELEKLYTTLPDLLKHVSKGSINYDVGNLFFKDVLDYYLDYANQAYKQLEQVFKEEEQTKHAFKTDLIRVFILKELDKVFTKTEIKEHFKSASDTTIMRVLTELKDEGYIIPLGTGRSAKWTKIKEPEMF